MRRSSSFLIALVALVPLFAQPGQPVRRLADMEPVLAKIATWEFNQSRDPLYEFIGFLQGAMEAKTDLSLLEAHLVRMLGPGTTLAGRDFVCRQLSVMGTPASVPALAGMLNEAAISDNARYALERIPGPAAADALRAALPASSGKAQIGLVNSLGNRREAQSVAPIEKLLTSADPATREAAFSALARICNGPALAAIARGRRGLSGPVREPASAAYLRCAGEVAAAGDRAAAIQVYRELSGADETDTIRMAALGGLASLATKETVPLLSRELESSNPEIQAAAIHWLNRIPGADVTAIFVQRFPRLPAGAQIRVLTALADRGAAAEARSMAAEAAKSGTAEVRVAALAVLGKAGDASSLPVLTQAAANTEGPEQSAARDSLYSLRGPGLDAAIVGAIGSSSGRVQVELIKAAAGRASTAAVAPLLGVARGPDRDAARESIRALRSLAGPAHAPALLELLVKTPNPGDRREAALTLASAIRRSPQPVISPVVAAYQASNDPPVRISLLDVMGQVSAAEALPALRSGLASPEPGVVRAAILGLSAWQSPDPIPDLLAAATTETNPARQILALRGLLKLISLPSDRPPDGTVKLLSGAMQLAKQPEEKRAILALLPKYPTKESLVLAQAAAADSALAGEAKAAADRISASLASKK